MQSGSMVPAGHLQAASIRIQAELEGTPSKVDNVKNPTPNAMQGEDRRTARREVKIHTDGDGRGFWPLLTLLLLHHRLGPRRLLHRRRRDSSACRNAAGG